MKIAVAQLKTIKGDLNAGILSHLKLIDLAAKAQADAVFFPELSLTGYESVRAHEIVLSADDPRLHVFQRASEAHHLTIALGFPTRTTRGIYITMMIFEPQHPPEFYSKQLLHSDEIPYFVNGSEQLILENGHHRLAPAICYESMQIQHLENALSSGATIYVACVADSAKGVHNAAEHYSKISRKYSLPVLMSNSIGFCDNFFSVGQSAVWNKNGLLLAQLDDRQEGVIVYDTEYEQTVIALV